MIQELIQELQNDFTVLSAFRHVYSGTAYGRVHLCENIKPLFKDRYIYMNMVAHLSNQVLIKPINSSGDGETGFRKRSNSAISLEKLKRKLSERDGSLLEEVW